MTVLVEARVISYHMKEMGWVQSMLCPESTCGWDRSMEASR